MSKTTITKVGQFLTWVRNSHTSTSSGLKWDHSKVFYRGQGNVGWDILPSLFRENIMLEHELLKNARNILWNELANTNSYLEKLILLQHYGLSTRLIDVTTNPLIALYFACKEEKDDKGEETDGVVWCGYPINEENNESIERICSIPFEQQLERIVSGIPGWNFDNQKDKSILTCAYYVNPPMNNPRINAQNGAFLLPPLLEEDKHSGEYFLTAKNVNDLFAKSVTIPASSKIAIQNELMEYGIHEGTLFPDIEHKIKYIKTMVNNSILKLADNR